MIFYTEEDKLSRGVALMLYVPLFLPYFYVSTETEMIYLGVLLLIFISMCYLYIPTLWNMYYAENNRRGFVLLVLITALVNFVFSFFIEEIGGFIWLVSGWSLFVSLLSSRKFSAYHPPN